VIAAVAIVCDDMLTRVAELPVRPGGAKVAALIVGGTGLDASETLEHDDANSHHAGAFTVRSTTYAYSFDEGVIVRLVNEFEIGGGASDHGVMFQGALLASLTGGYRFSITKNQGPFIRAGILGLVAGNDLFYRSALALPDAHVGYQYLISRKFLAEAAYTTSFVLTGRSDAEGDSHNLDLALAIGALVSLHTDPISITARWMHTFPTQSATDVDWLEGALCAEPGKTLALCVRARWDRTDVSVTQFGFTLGTQQRKRLHSAGLY
jgi:hypothetical protein